MVIIITLGGAAVALWETNEDISISYFGETCFIEVVESSILVPFEIHNWRSVSK